MSTQTTISPYSQEPYCVKHLSSPEELTETIHKARDAQVGWRRTSIEDRVSVAKQWLIEFEMLSSSFGEELALQMGRPVSQKGEPRGVIARSNYLIDIAADALKPVMQDGPGSSKKITKEPLGVIVVISPWNYPFTCVANWVIPAILSGNAVIVKPSPQSPLAAERILEAFELAGLPDGVLQVIHLDQKTALDNLVANGDVDFVAFTGSVDGGRAVQQAASHGQGFKEVALELGGKDPAYVRADAMLETAVPALLDASMFNSGQSCCSVERIYVHHSIHDKFVEDFVERARQYRIGNPLLPTTNLGPVISLQSAKRIRQQISEAVAAGAILALSEASFPEAAVGSTVMGPQVLVNVDHSMSIMTEETFGPVAAIMKVSDDDEALRLMNDSQYGLTASVWTSSYDESLATFERFAAELQAGTVYLNKADTMDGFLPWSGVKDSGRGLSLSMMAFDQLTRVKAISM